jgi:hypothetical protein
MTKLIVAFQISRTRLKLSQLMLYSEIFAVCSQIHREREREREREGRGVCVVKGTSYTQALWGETEHHFVRRFPGFARLSFW